VTSETDSLGLKDNIAILIDDQIMVALKDDIKQTWIEAGSESILLTTRAARGEPNRLEEFAVWYNDLISKLVELGWRTLASQTPDKPWTAESKGSPYVQLLAKQLGQLVGVEQSMGLTKAISATIDYSRRFSGEEPLVGSDNRSLCRGLSYLFPGQNGLEFALTYAWMSDLRKWPPSLVDFVDKGSIVWILGWRGQLVESIYDPDQVRQVLDGEIKGWRNLIVVVPPSNVSSREEA
jgi:hypothetical protein